MCLIAIAYRTHPDLPIIIAANRDEFYSRPTSPLDFWEDHPQILAGRDLEGSGTWLGVTRTGRIAAVTNYRQPGFKSGGVRSRGFLVSDYLAGKDSPETYLAGISREKDRYNGFNLVVGNCREFWWFSNKGGEITRLEPGVHTISNHLLNTPWPKSELTGKRMEKLIHTRSVTPENIFQDILSDHTPPPDYKLPDTGVGLKWERILSPPFVISDSYGTRSSSVITIDKNNLLSFCERTFRHDGNRPIVIETRQFDLQIESIGPSDP